MRYSLGSRKSELTLYNLVGGKPMKKCTLLTAAVAAALLATTAQADSIPVETLGALPQTLEERRWDMRLVDPSRPFAFVEARYFFIDSSPTEALPAASDEQDAPADGLFAEAVVSTLSGAPLGNVTAIATGESHSCALLGDGTVRCWGYNRFGQLGNGTTTDSPAAMPVVGLGRRVTAISAGAYHTCALLDNGIVKCWGYNAHNQLGDGTFTHHSLPVTVIELSSVIAIAAGDFHTCALLSNGTVRCWGDNWYGRLGDGTTNSITTPVTVRGLNGVTAIAAGFAHSCALLNNRTLRCWGGNWAGQVGDGTRIDRTTPVAVNGLSDVTTVAVGTFHTCARLNNGTIYCWGYNLDGQLGNETVISSTTPVMVSGLSGSSAVAARYRHSCALLNNRTVRCWGANWYGQLGDGTRTNQRTPVTVSGLNDATAIATGNKHTCALLSNGRVRCWGRNNYGQLGNSVGFHRNVPSSVIGLGMPAIAIATGMSHNCALLSDRTVRCWGRNDFRQLGDGTTVDSATPVAVSGLSNVTAIAVGQYHTCALLSDGTVRCWGSVPSVANGLSNVIAIAAGEHHTCALLNDGTVKCWGANWYGQLGDGTTTYRSTPVTVINLGGAANAITAGYYHTCARLTSGMVRCWGNNWYGQLGDGTMTDRTTPVTVSGVSGVVTLAAGGYHTCALLSDGTAKCWGNNCFGQLGDIIEFDAPPIVTVNGLTGATAITAGWGHTCARLSNGTARCWGDNDHGQLGNGTTLRSTTPVPVIRLGGSVAAISISGDHSCALLSNGVVRCWGDNTFGQLGNGEMGHTMTPSLVRIATSTFLPILRRP